nr:hypothetical protein Iba_chr01cCG7320 [Ipomoea batatas]
MALPKRPRPHSRPRAPVAAKDHTGAGFTGPPVKLSSGPPRHEESAGGTAAAGADETAGGRFGSPPPKSAGASARKAQGGNFPGRTIQALLCGGKTPRRPKRRCSRRQDFRPDGGPSGGPAGSHPLGWGDIVPTLPKFLRRDLLTTANGESHYMAFVDVKRAKSGGLYSRPIATPIPVYSKPTVIYSPSFSIFTLLAYTDHNKPKGLLSSFLIWKPELPFRYRRIIRVDSLSSNWKPETLCWVS